MAGTQRNKVVVQKPRRTTLSVPGHLPRFHSKAAGSTADVIMLDLEDSCPPAEKVAARESVVRAVRDNEWSKKTLSLRVNAVNGPFVLGDLIG